MGQPAEMLHSLTSNADLALERPLTARKALAVWVALSAIGWTAIAVLVSVTLF
jgi:hypothetical protein